MRRDVFQAIADPTRREIINLLVAKPLTLNHVADHFHISRPAISRHVKILVECGLVTVRPRGRERVCQAQPESLREVHEWVERYRVFWTGKLDGLEKFLARKSRRDKAAKRNIKISKTKRT